MSIPFYDFPSSPILIIGALGITVAIGSSVTVLTGVTPSVQNPTRDNDLIYRVNSGGTAWEYVSGA